MDGSNSSEATLDLKAAAPPERTVAVICFVPDTGHVMPLLRLARLVARQSGARVACFLPASFEQAATGFGFAFHRLDGLDQGASAPLFAALSRKSIFYSAFSNDQDLLDHYWGFLHQAISRELGGLVAGLDAVRPSLVLADTHSFGREYRQLAARCGAPLVMNRAVGGALAFRPRRFERVYGLSEHPAWLQRLVELAGGVQERVLRRWRRLRRVEHHVAIHLGVQGRAQWLESWECRQSLGAGLRTFPLHRSNRHTAQNQETN